MLRLDDPGGDACACDRLPIGIVNGQPARCGRFEHEPMNLVAAVISEQVDHAQTQTRLVCPESKGCIDACKFLRAQAEENETSQPGLTWSATGPVPTHPSSSPPPAPDSASGTGKSFGIHDQASDRRARVRLEQEAKNKRSDESVTREPLSVRPRCL